MRFVNSRIGFRQHRSSWPAERYFPRPLVTALKSNPMGRGSLPIEEDGFFSRSGAAMPADELERLRSRVERNAGPLSRRETFAIFDHIAAIERRLRECQRRLAASARP